MGNVIKYKSRELPGPGTGNLAFLPFHGLPMEYFMGAGHGTNSQLIGLQTRNQVFVEDRAIIEGLPGVNAGSMGSTELIDMADYLSGLSRSAGL